MSKKTVINLNKVPKTAHPNAGKKFMHGSGAKAMTHKKGSC